MTKNRQPTTRRDRYVELSLQGKWISLAKLWLIDHSPCKTSHYLISVTPLMPTHIRQGKGRVSQMELARRALGKLDKVVVISDGMILSTKAITLMDGYQGKPISDLNEVGRGQLCDQAADCLRNGAGRLANLPGLIKRIIETQAWVEREYRPGQTVTMKSLAELITTPPQKGWGEDPKTIEAVIKADPEVLAMFREAMNGTLTGHGGDHKSEQVKQDQHCAARLKQYGTNDYWQARIQRDCPEELEDIKSGEKRIIDVRRERGWVPTTKRVTLTGDWSIDRQRLRDAFGDDYLKGILNQ